jgi:serine/threonine protein phosphatase PrpC
VEVETVSFEVEAGDVLLLCSDGLSRSLGTEIPADFDSIDPRSADRILADALENDGSDNISFVIVSAA